jgi:hypothetical protein
LPSPQQANCSKKGCNVKALASIGQGIQSIRRPRKRFRPDNSKDSALASQRELSDFLGAIERRAFKQAMFAVRNEESALDIVQDAMMKLAEKYGDRPAAELPLLFPAHPAEHDPRLLSAQQGSLALDHLALIAFAPATTRITTPSKPSAAKPGHIARRPRTTSFSNRKSLR